MHSDSTKIAWTQDGIYMEGSNKLASGEDHPILQAVKKVYEQCGGEVGEKKTRVSWRTENPYPVWTEEDGWHFEGVKCSPPPEDGAEA